MKLIDDIKFGKTIWPDGYKIIESISLVSKNSPKIIIFWIK